MKPCERRFTRYAPRSPQAGFTLIEVMIALAILAGMSLVMFISTNQILNSKGDSEDRDEAHHSIFLALNKFTEDLGMAFLLKSKDILGADFDGEVGFQGKEDRVDFVNFSHSRYVQGAQESEVAEVSYFVEPMPDEPDKKMLMRRESTVVDKNLQEGGRAYPLLEGIEDAHFEYYDSKDGEYKKLWDTQSVDFAGKLPRAVKITIDIILPGQEDKSSFSIVAPIELNTGPISF